MFYDNKYLAIYTGESYIEYPPFFYVDFFKISPNLKRHWRDNHEFTFGFKCGKFILTLNVRWGFVERPKTEEEQERHEKIKDLIDRLEKGGRK